MQVFDMIAAAEFSADGLAKKNLFSSPRMFLDIYCLEPEQAQAVHTHTDNDKAYLVIQGRVEVTLGAERELLGPGQAAVAPAGVPHGITNHSGSRAVVAVVMAPHPSWGREKR